MLENPEFVPQTSKKAEAGQYHPSENSPSGEPVRHHRHRLYLHVYEIGKGPLCEEERPVYDNRQEYSPRRPPMEPVKPFIRDTAEQRYNVELAGKTKQEWNLSDADPSSPEGYLFPFVSVQGIIGSEHDVGPEHGEDDEPVYRDGNTAASGGRGEVSVEPTFEDPWLRIGHFAEDGRCRCIGLGEYVFGL